MKNKIITYQYQNEKAETLKLNLKRKLFDYATTQGLHDGSRGSIITILGFFVLLIEVVKTHVQSVLDELKEILQVDSMLFNVKASEEMLYKRQEQINRESNLNAHRRNSLLNDKESLPPQNKHITHVAYWLLPISIAFGIIDFGISFESFRIVYPFLLAIIMAAGVGIMVFSAHFLALWVKKTKRRKARIIQIVVVLGSALVFFIVIALLRTQALNNQITIAVDDYDFQQRQDVSFLPFATISFLMFATSFIIVLFFSKTAEERKIEEKHAAIDKEINEINKKQEALQMELQERIKLLEEQKKEARIIFSYLMHSIKECKAYGNVAISEYKKVYVQASGMVPDFFAEEHIMEYDESFVFNLKAQEV